MNFLIVVRGSSLRESLLEYLKTISIIDKIHAILEVSYGTQYKHAFSYANVEIQIS